MGVHLLTGDDESILRSKAHDLIHHLVGDSERSLMVDEFDGEEYELRDVADAAQTMPFLTDKRVVVARSHRSFQRGRPRRRCSSISATRSTRPSSCSSAAVVGWPSSSPMR